MALPAPALPQAGLDCERVWAIEDCRHVSGAFERFLIARGERIVRVAPKHMAGARRSSRERGKSDSIDAFSVARAALKEGLENLPGAHLDGAALDIRLLVDHREDLIAARDQRSTAAALASARPLARVRDPGRSAGHDQVAGEGLAPALASASRPRGCGSRASSSARSPHSTRRIRELEAELTALVESYAPQLLGRARLRATDRRQADRRDRRR